MAKKFFVSQNLKMVISRRLGRRYGSSGVVTPAAPSAVMPQGVVEPAPASTVSVVENSNDQLDDRFCVHQLNWLRVNDPVPREVFIVGVESLPDDLIACILEEDLNQFMTMDQVTQFFGSIIKNRMPYSPSYGELCMAELDSKVWCRAIHLGWTVDQGSNMRKVFCVDFGITCVVPKINIRVISYKIKS